MRFLQHDYQKKWGMQRLWCVLWRPDCAHAVLSWAFLDCVQTHTNADPPGMALGENAGTVLAMDFKVQDKFW